jgi:hypothetical protein
MLFVLSLVALGGSGLRLASLAIVSGASRVIGAAVLTAAMAAAEAILLGAVGLGMEAGWLAAAAAATWVATWRLCPRPETGLLAEGVAAWGRCSLPARLGLCAGAGAAGAWVLWQLRYPALGNDAVLYHVPVSLAFVQDGNPGGVPGVMDALPMGAYPSMDELLSGWVAALSRGLLGFTVLPSALLVLAVTALYTALRELGADRLVSALAAASVTLAPQAIGWQFTGGVTDPAAMCWVACCGALCAASLKRPAAFSLALVAAGLAVGTKTTAIPLTGGLLVATAIHLRGRVLDVPRLFAFGASLGAFVGLVWYVRNLVRFGSPLWPFYSSPWGDPIPPGLKGDLSFIDHPGSNFEWLSHDHFSHFGGPLLLLLAGAVVPLFTRGRGPLLAAGATVASVILWVNAPLTGAPGPIPPQAMSTVRYLLPALAIAATGLALASRAGNTIRLVVVAGLAAAVGLSVLQGQTELGRPTVVPLYIVALGAAGGIVLAAALQAARGTVTYRRSVAVAAVAMTAVVVGIGLSLAAPGYASRHARLDLWQSDVQAWLGAQPGYARGDRPVLGLGLRPGILAGSRLEHHVTYMTGDSACSDVRRRARDAWVVVFSWGGVPVRSERCLAPLRPAYTASFRVYQPTGPSLLGGVGPRP